MVLVKGSTTPGLDCEAVGNMPLALITGVGGTIDRNFEPEHRGKLILADKDFLEEVMFDGDIEVCNEDDGYPNWASEGFLHRLFLHGLNDDLDDLLSHSKGNEFGAEINDTTWFGMSPDSEENVTATPVGADSRTFPDQEDLPDTGGIQFWHRPWSENGPNLNWLWYSFSGIRQEQHSGGEAVDLLLRTKFEKGIRATDGIPFVDDEGFGRYDYKIKWEYYYYRFYLFGIKYISGIRGRETFTLAEDNGSGETEWGSTNWGYWADFTDPNHPVKTANKVEFANLDSLDTASLFQPNGAVAMAGTIASTILKAYNSDGTIDTF